MANPNRTDYEGPPLSGSGILWINSKVTDPDSLPVEAFTKWYENVHIPDIIAAKPGGIVSSWRYKCADPGRSAPYLAVYKAPDIGFIQSKEFKSIPMVHPSLPGNGPIHRFADFDARFLGHVETWKSQDARDGRYQSLVSEAVEPSAKGGIEFDLWYRSTYIKSLSRIAGWKRTSRFRLVFKKENKTDTGAAKEITPTFLALHEFDSDSLAAVEMVKACLKDSDKGARLHDNAAKVDIAPFEFLRGFGDLESQWVDTQEEPLPGL